MVSRTTLSEASVQLFEPSGGSELCSHGWYLLFYLFVFFSRQALRPESQQSTGFKLWLLFLKGAAVFALFQITNLEFPSLLLFCRWFRIVLMWPLFCCCCALTHAGIAWDAARKRLFITGKYWPRVFEVNVKLVNPNTPANKARLAACAQPEWRLGF